MLVWHQRVQSSLPLFPSLFLVFLIVRNTFPVVFRIIYVQSPCMQPVSFLLCRAAVTFGCSDCTGPYLAGLLSIPGPFSPGSWPPWVAFLSQQPPCLASAPCGWLLALQEHPPALLLVVLFSGLLVSTGCPSTSSNVFLAQAQSWLASVRLLRNEHWQCVLLKDSEQQFLCCPAW